MLSTFDVTPVAMPTLVAVDARLATVGDEITVTWNNPETGGNEIAIVSEGGDPGDAIETTPAPGPERDDRGSTPPAGIPAPTRRS